MLRKMIVGLLLPLVLLSISAACANSGDDGWKAKGKELASKLQLTIKPQQGKVKAGQPVTLSVSIKNVSTEEVTVECNRNMYDDYTFQVTDARKKEAPATNFLRQQKVYTLDERSMESLTGYKLKPGQSADCSLNAGVFFDLSLPGKYSITVKRGLPLPICLEGVVSNTVEVTVLEPEASYTITDAK